MIRAKMRCGQVTKADALDASRPGAMNEHVNLHAVYSESGENAVWSRATPNGSLLLTISNPDAQGRFVPGAEYFVDVTMVPPAPVETKPEVAS